jgi:hypothetical protein
VYSGGAVVDALMTTLQQQLQVVFDATLEWPEDAPVEHPLISFQKIDSPGRLADLVTYAEIFTLAERLALLAILDSVERLRRVSSMLARQIEELR